MRLELQPQQQAGTVATRQRPAPPAGGHDFGPADQLHTLGRSKCTHALMTDGAEVNSIR
jgi:hypothetical protein